MSDNFTLQSAIAFATFSLAIILVSKIVLSYSTKSHADYFVGSRSFGRFFIALSVGAAGNSGVVMIANVGFAYTVGISALLFPLSFFLGDLVFWSFFPHKVNQLSAERNCFTVPELLNSAVTSNPSGPVRKVSGLLILLLIGLFGAGQFYAAGIAIDGAFNIGAVNAIVLATVIIISYGALGGVKTSIWIGVIYAVMMFITVVGILFTAIYLAGGVDEIIVKLNNIEPALLDPFAGFTTIGLIGYILGFSFAGFGFGLTSPHLLVRLFSGKSAEETRAAKWIYLGFLYSVWISTTLFGVVARVIMPDIADPEQAIPVFAITYLSPWLVGFVLVGVFSAIASTADSALLVFTSSIGVDIMPTFYNRMTRKYGNWYRFSLFILGAFIYALIAIQLTGLLDAMIFVISALPATLGPAMLIILLKWKTTSSSLVATIVIGFVVSVIWTAAGLNNIIASALPGFIVAIFVHYMIVALRPQIEVQ